MSKTLRILLNSRRDTALLASLLASVLAAGLAAAPPAGAEIFHSRESALREAFPTAERVVETPRILSPDQRQAAEERAGAALESSLVTAWTAWHEGAIVGTAYLDTHPVRTLPETVLVVVDPAGRVREVLVLAFHEPPEYLPPAGWLARLRGRPLDAHLWPGRGVDALTGATFSARAVAAAARRALAVHAVTEPAGPPGPAVGSMP